MNSQKLATLPAYCGLRYDAETGKMFDEDGQDTGYTFEQTTWRGPFGLTVCLPWRNPISNATRETGIRVLAFARRAAPQGLLVSLDETRRECGPFRRTNERQIVVSDGSVEESFSAGWIAATIIRHGEARAAKLWRSELRHAGLLN
jgi:hypothetical protein